MSTTRPQTGDKVRHRDGWEGIVRAVLWDPDEQRLLVERTATLTTDWYEPPLFEVVE